VVGDPQRRKAMFPRGGIEAALRGGQRIVAHSTVDVDALCDSAHVVIESGTPAWRPGPGFDPIGGGPRIWLRITPFGSTGPYRSFASSAAVEEALSGHLYLTGDPERAPIVGPEHQTAVAAGIHGAIGIAAALAARQVTGRGQLVEVSHLGVLVPLHQFTLLRYTHSGDVLRRMGNRYAGPGRPIGAYRCADGMISLVVPRDDQLERLLGVAGLDHLIDEPGIGSTYDLMHHPTLIDEHLVPWLETQKASEIVELLQALRVPAGPVSSLGDVLADQHLAARGFWRQVDVGTTGPPTTVRVPGPPFRITERQLAGEAPPLRSAATRTVDQGPLTGIRVLDLTRVWAGPLAARVLADLGADVIMVEAPWARGPSTVDRSSVLATRYYPDNDPGDRHWNRNGFLNKYALNKRGIALDLSLPEGVETFEALVAVSDVVIENYSPRVMPQLGLDEERLHHLNPRLLYVTMPGYGRTGPSVDRVAYGPMIDSHAGLSVLQGYPEDPARKGGVAWPDPLAGLHAAFAIVSALASSADDGRGRTVEGAQFESTVATIGYALAELQLTGSEPERRGNRHRHHAPQGVYPCQGEDRWLALTVTDERSWQSVCEIAGLDASWQEWDLEERRARHDAIDEALEAWCRSRTAGEAMARLQAAGVAAGTVNDAAGVMADPHLADTGAFVALTHPEAGTHLWPRLAIEFSDTPATYRRAAPLLNQHADEVLCDLAGLSPQRLEELRAAGVVRDRPPD
ncbi:MAG: CoA transferase, partial [Actinomycetota bacterium]|nr:CoA transferase [Actinomycetota bacterium]